MPTLLAVALQNHPGSLADVLEALGAASINVEAIEAEAMGDFGNVRLLASDPPSAAKVLRGRGFDVVEAEAIEIDLPNRAGELARIARRLAAGGVNVVSLFGTVPAKGGDGRLLLRVNNVEKARGALAAGAGAKGPARAKAR